MRANAFSCHSIDTKANLNYKNVLDSCFKMNPGFCFYADMMSPRDDQMLVIEEMVCDTVPKRKGHALPCRATQRSTRVSREQKG